MERFENKRKGDMSPLRARLDARAAFWRELNANLYRSICTVKTLRLTIDRVDFSSDR